MAASTTWRPATCCRSRHAAIRYRQPNFWVDLPQRTEVELLVRAESKSSMQVPLALYTFSAFAEMERDAQLGIGLYDGILLALFFYNLVLWISLRDSSHFWYMCHIAGFGLVMFCLNGLAFEYLWPNSPWLANLAIPLSMCLSQMAMHQFARVFLELKERWPLGDLISRGFIYSYALVGIARSGSITAGRCSWARSACSPACWRCCTRPSTPSARGYRAGAPVPGGLDHPAAGHGPVRLDLVRPAASKNFITEYGIQIGSAMEMILLSFALAYRYANLRSENERIVREANEQLERNVARRTAELSSALEQLADANSRLRESNRRDALTGVFNRRHFREVFEHMMHQAAETRQPLGVLLIDLDHFKKINDTHGHLAGDECLRVLARSSTTRRWPRRRPGRTLRRRGIRGGVAGGQFGARAGNRRTPAPAHLLANRCATAGKEIHITGSIGTFSVPPGLQLQSPTMPCTRPTTRCMSAKNAGRNRVHARRPESLIASAGGARRAEQFALFDQEHGHRHVAIHRAVAGMKAMSRAQAHEARH